MAEKRKSEPERAGWQKNEKLNRKEPDGKKMKI